MHILTMRSSRKERAAAILAIMSLHEEKAMLPETPGNNIGVNF